MFFNGTIKLHLTFEMMNVWHGVVTSTTVNIIYGMKDNKIEITLRWVQNTKIDNLVSYPEKIIQKIFVNLMPERLSDAAFPK